MKSERTSTRSTLTLHRELYERRLQRMQQRSGISEREAAERANDPSKFRRGPRPLDAVEERETEKTG